MSSRAGDEPNGGVVTIVEDDCHTCGESDGAEGECPKSKRPCGHHCNCSWVHDCCHWCGAEFGEEGEPQVGAVVAYVKDGEPHLAWREPCANQENDHHWHVFHGMTFGWRTWREVNANGVRFLGVHDAPAHAHAFGPWQEADQSNSVRECECGARQWD